MIRKAILWGVILILGLLSWTTIVISEDKNPEEKETPKGKKEYRIELKYTKGEKISVEKRTTNNLNINGKIKMTINTGETTQNQESDTDTITSTDMTTKYEEELLEVSEKGEVTKVKREYLKDDISLSHNFIFPAR